LLRSRLRVQIPPAGVRRYDNVTVYASWGHALGKAKLRKSIPNDWSMLARSIKSSPSSPSRTLVCLNQVVEEAIDLNDPHSEGISISHWGALNGKNTWRAHDAVAIVGLPYLDHVTPINMVLGLIGPQTDEWLQSPNRRTFGTHHDIVSAVRNGHIASSVLQAINRVRCRKVVDAQGNCAPTSVFMMLPRGETGEQLLATIEHQMPGVRIALWALRVAPRKRRQSASASALIAHFHSAPVGHHERDAVQSQLGVSPTTLDRFLARTRDPATSEHADMARLNITYHSTTGRGAKAYFVKV
jgi:hypothetical protein